MCTFLGKQIINLKYDQIGTQSVYLTKSFYFWNRGKANKFEGGKGKKLNFIFLVVENGK